MKTERKKFINLVKSDKIDEANQAIKGLDSTIQKLKSKGIMHKKTASRMISRLAKKINNRIE